MRKRPFLLLIPLAVILIIGAAVFFLTRPPDYLSWIDDATLPGSCETAAVLDWVNASPLSNAPQGHITQDEALTAARVLVSEFYPGVDISSVQFRHRMLIEADMPTGVRAPAYLVTAYWTSEAESNYVAAVILMNSANGGVYRIIHAVNVQPPAETCFKDR